MKSDFKEKALFVQLFGDTIYAVGGYVRDLISKNQKKKKEIDILITHHTVNEITNKLKAYGRIDLVGKSFGVIKFSINGNTYDIALPRKDISKGKKRPSHKDFLIHSDPFLPIEKDLSRRDFRCNSMALRLIDDTIIDPFGGKKDTSNKILKLTNPQAFPEDPLRVLRAARFASVLNFKIDPEIYIISNRIDLSTLSVERINEEIFKILLDSQKPSVGLESLFKLGALKKIFPELYRLTLTIQDSIFHPEKDKYGHHTVWEHTKLTVDQAKRLGDIYKINQSKNLTLILAALFHDVGKPFVTNWDYKKGRMVITSIGHDKESKEITKSIFNRLKIYSWNGFDVKKYVLLLIKNHHRLSELWNNRETVSKKAFNRLAADISGEIELLIYLDAADRGGRKKRAVKGLDKEGKWLLNKFNELNINKDTIKPILLGRDLIKLGVKPGPSMGKMLKKLYSYQLDNKFTTKEEGIEIAKEMIKEKP